MRMIMGAVFLQKFELKNMLLRSLDRKDQYFLIRSLACSQLMSMRGFTKNGIISN